MKVVGIIGSLRVANPCLSDLTAFYAVSAVLGSVSEKASACLCALSKTRSGQMRIASRISSVTLQLHKTDVLFNERKKRRGNGLID